MFRTIAKRLSFGLLALEHGTLIFRGADNSRFDNRGCNYQLDSFPYYIKHCKYNGIWQVEHIHHVGHFGHAYGIFNSVRQH